jgi:hypothetical protein
MFLKAASSVAGPGDGIELRLPGRRVDHELEMVAVVGRSGRRMADFDYDLFTIGAGSGGVRAAASPPATARACAIAEDPGRRHLRDPRLRAQEAAGLRLALRRRLRGRRRLRLDASCRSRPFDWPTLIANKDREIARLEGLSTATCSRSRASKMIESRAVGRRPAHRRGRGDRRITARHHPGRDRRRPHAARDPGRSCASRPTRRSPARAARRVLIVGRRLHRGRVRRASSAGSGAR